MVDSQIFGFTHRNWIAMTTRHAWERVLILSEFLCGTRALPCLCAVVVGRREKQGGRAIHWLGLRKIIKGSRGIEGEDVQTEGCNHSI